MCAATLSALALALALPALGQPSLDANPAPASKPDVLVEIFQAQLAPEQTAKLEQPVSAGRIVALFTAPQRTAAKRTLAARAASTKDDKELAQIVRGYELLGEPQGLIEIGAQLATQNPKDSMGYSVAAEGMAKRGDDQGALELADQALALNPNDRRAIGIRILIESRRRYGSSKGSGGAAAQPIEAAMVKVPHGAAYRAAADMVERPNPKLAQSASHALSQLRPSSAPPLPNEEEVEGDAAPAAPRPLTAAAAAAAATVGSLLLFFGLLPKSVDERHPWLKPSMTGGMLLIGGLIAYDLAASHFIFGRYIAWKTPPPSAAAPAAAVPNAVPAGQSIEAAKQGVHLVKGNVNHVVLGRFPEYTELADRLRATRLQVPIEIWNKMTKQQQWEANRRFLDRAIARGDQFVLATDPFQAKKGTFYSMELHYLTEKGYELNDAATKLLKR